MPQYFIRWEYGTTYGQLPKMRSFWSIEEAVDYCRERDRRRLGGLHWPVSAAIGRDWPSGLPLRERNRALAVEQPDQEKARRLEAALERDRLAGVFK